MQGFYPERPRTPTRSTRRSPRPGCRRSSTPARRGIGAGQRGGGGIRLKYSNPMYVDDVAVDFPDMPIVLAHPVVPLAGRGAAVAMHKPQVYIDLSGWSPKYFPPQLVQYANTLLKDKVLFGSDFPLITPNAGWRTSSRLDSATRCEPLILKENAARLLGLTDGSCDMTAMYFEDFEVGATFSTTARTITEADVVLFAGLSGDFNPLHVDHESSKAGAFRGADRARAARALGRVGARRPNRDLHRHQSRVSRDRGSAIRRRRAVWRHDPHGVDGDRDPQDEQAQTAES